MSRASFYKAVVLVLLFLTFAVFVVFSILDARAPITPVHVEQAGERQSAVFAVDDPLNINTASAEELTALPGIGEVTAQRIVAYRTENGAFHDLGELREVEGIGSATLEKLLPYIICEQTKTR